MGDTTWLEPLISAQTDGPTITAATATSCLPTHARYTLPAGFFKTVGKQIAIEAGGRISCVVTTPGTARFDIRFTSAGGGTITVFDGLAVPLNVVAKTNVAWYLKIMLTCRAVGGGTSANLFQWGEWVSQASIGAPGDTVAGAGTFQLPYNTAPAVGNGFDSTAAQLVDMFFTQTVATGSMTLHWYRLLG